MAKGASLTKAILREIAWSFCGTIECLYKIEAIFLLPSKWFGDILKNQSKQQILCLTGDEVANTSGLEDSAQSSQK